MRNVLAYGLTALALWTITGCSGGGNGRDDIQTVSSTGRFQSFDQDLEFTLTSRAFYRQGETVSLVFTVKNIGQRRVEFLAGPPYADAKALRANTEVWRWSAGKVFPAIIGEISLQPGEVETYVLEWDQKDAQGNYVAAGTYTVNAWFTAFPNNAIVERPRDAETELDAGPIEITLRFEAPLN